ncbi:hypothetical protein [Acinetobacter johnsonii]|uniref:hypothetical protein n=1 Tax=Acinetobacter johnsonii TaxID=40214 RepID=UPI001D195DB1|nr:hypothetical protein [Acinetobacter johnsonii]
MDIQKEREAFERFKAKQIGIDYETLKKDLDDCEKRFPNNRYAGWNFKSDWELWQAATAQAVPDGFVLVPKAGAQYFSHDFNGDGFKYHDTLDEAKKEAEVNLDWYRDQVADGRHVNDMGEFNELSYGLVIGSAEYSIDHVVTQDDIDKGEYSYEVGTEILSLYLSEAKEQSHECQNP